MPKHKNNSGLSQEDIDKLRESFDAQFNQLEALGVFPKSKLVKAAKLVKKDAENVKKHTQGEKQHYWCGVLGGTVETGLHQAGTYMMGALTGGLGTLFSQPAITHSANAWGNLAQRGCNATTNYFTNNQKASQKSQAASSLVQNRTQHQSTNAYQPRFVGLSGTNSFHSPSSFGGASFKARPFSMTSPSSFLTRLSVERAVKEGVRREMGSLKPNMNYAFTQIQASLHFGLGYNLSKSEFRSLASSTNLISSYNNFNPGSKLRDVSSFCRDIGGVASRVGTITDLINSDVQSDADNYIICLPREQFPFSKTMLSQIQQELKDAYFIHKTSPFFSLHFNNQGYLYPVAHAAFQNTLVGEIIALLDYWMKCFLNGGVFDEDFLKLWHETRNCDETYLKEKMKDLKKYCETEANGLPYDSLREFMNRHGLKDGKGTKDSPYQQPFMTSFRIIAVQEGIERYENLLFPHPDFQIEYSIDLMPDYKNYIESYRQVNGQYPSDYQRTRECYELFAIEIKEKMQKLPFCQDFFRLLGFMNTLSYFYATLDQMGKQPDLPPLASKTENRIPKAFPPIPVRYFETKTMDIQFSEVLDRLITSIGSEAALDELLLASLSAPQRKASLPQPVIQGIKTSLVTIVKSRLSAQDVDTTTTELSPSELKKYTQITIQLLTQQLQRLQLTVSQLTHQSANVLGAAERSHLTTLPLPNRIQATQNRLAAYEQATLTRWDANPALARTEVFNVISDDMMTTIEGTNEEIKTSDYLRNRFRLIEEDVAKSMPDIIETIQRDIQEEKERVIEKVHRIINKKRDIENKIAIDRDQINGGIAANANMRQIIAEKNAIIGQAHQEIARVKNDFANWMGQYSAAILAANQATVSQNRADTDAEVARLSAFIPQLNQEIAEINAHIAHNTTVIADREKNILSRNEGLNRFLNLIQTEFSPIALARTEAVIGLRFIDIEGDPTEIINKLNTHYAAKAQTAVEEAPTGIFNMNCLIEAKDQFQQILSNRRASLGRLSKLLNHLINTLKKEPKLMEFKVAKTYTHTVIGFTSDELHHKIGDQFKIVGGCGVSLPNLKSRPSTKSPTFIAAVADAFGATTQNLVEFTAEGEAYTALRIQVAPQVSQDQTLSEPQLALCDTFITVLQNEDSLTITEAGLNEAVDESGAFLSHYIASHLSASQMKNFIDAHPDQLNKRDHFGHLPLHAAAKANQAEVVSLILSKNPAQLEACNQRQTTPLMTAIEYGSKETVDVLLALSANANHLLPNGLFPLMLAVSNNFTDIAQSLLKNGREINLNLTLDSGVTALHLALENQMQEVALALIAQGAAFTLPRKSDGYTAWHVAASLGNVACIQAMVARGATLDAPLESKKTALHLTAEAGHFELVQVLLPRGASVNAKSVDGETPLMLAIKAGQTQVAEKLAEVSPINDTNKQNQSAALLAIQCSQLTVADCLIARGEDPLLQDKHEHSYLYYVVRNGEFHRFLNLVETHQIALNHRIKSQPLINIAAEYSHFDIVYYLLDQGCEFTATHRSKDLLSLAVMADEITYLKDQAAEKSLPFAHLSQLATQSGSVRCLDFLLDQLTKEEVIESQLLKIAITHGHSSCVSAIIKKQGEVRLILDTQGNTPLHLAAATGNTKNLELIAKSGADFSAKNAGQKTAFHLAFTNNDAHTFKKLLKLSQPSEWPADLWSVNRIGLDASLKTALAKYEKRLPNNAPVNEMTVSSDSEPVLDDRIQGDRRQALIDLLTAENFDEALVLLSQQGSIPGEMKNFGEALRIILENTYDYSQLIESLGLSAEEADLSWKPEKLLHFLKSNGMDPRRFTGHRNPLLSILNSHTDEEACYRLAVFSSVFPESMPALIQDKVLLDHNCTDIALMKEFNEFFEHCDKLCKIHHTEESPAYHPLHQAIEADRYELAAKLLQRGAAVDRVNTKGQTPLMLAAKNGNLPIVQLLISHGAQPDRCDLTQENCLHYALKGKSETVALYLLPLMRKPNHATHRGITPLLTAAESGLLSVVSALCADSDAMNQVDHLGRNALHFAAIKGQVKVIDTLVKLGFDINLPECPPTEKKSARSLKRTALHYAALNAKTEAVTALLALGADALLADKLGNTVCEYAVMSKDAEMLHLVSCLPLYHQPEREPHLVKASVIVDNTDVLSEMILSDSALTTLDTYGNSALHIAAEKNSGNTLQLLLQGGDIPLNLKNNAGLTSLHIAAKGGHVRPLEALLDAGADINQKSDSGSTALTIAAENGHLGAVVTLLKYQADTALKDGKGLTAAQLALLSGYHDVACRILLSGDQSLRSSVITTLSPELQAEIFLQLPALTELLKLALSTPSLCRFGVFTSVASHVKATVTPEEKTASLRVSQ